MEGSKAAPCWEVPWPLMNLSCAHFSRLFKLSSPLRKARDMGLSSSVCPEWNSQQWPQAFATSPWTRPLLTVSFRALWAAIFTAHVLWNWWVRGRLDGEGGRSQLVSSYSIQLVSANRA